MGGTLGVTSVTPEEEAEEVAWVGADNMRHYERSTYFSVYEVALIAKAWRRLCTQRGTLTQDMFLEAFARIDIRSQVMLDSLFNAVDANSNKELDFKEAVQALSTMTRGTPAQKAHLSFRICDLNNDNAVSYQEALTAFREMSGMLLQLGQDPATFGSPQYVADNLYRYQSVAKMGNWTALLRRVGIHPSRVAKNETVITAPSAWIQNAIFRSNDKQGRLSLTRKQWERRAMRQSNVAECFGLFDLIHKATVRRWEVTKTQRYIEGILHVRVDSKLPHRSKRFYCVCAERFLVLYKSEQDQRPAEVIPLDATAVDARDLERCLYLTGTHRRNWRFIASSKEEALRWALAMRVNVQPVTRFNSFSPPRKYINAKWYINGASYFEDVADAMEASTRRILIADWFLSPQLPLKRNRFGDELDYWRLDHVLKRKAEQGIAVCIQVWDESSLGFHSLRSADAETYFHSHCPSIMFLRHPKWRPLRWTHHQKCVIVDNVAFIGGIDLAWGRYDNNNFMLVDPEERFYPGRDFVNLIITHVECGGDQPMAQVNRKRNPRMPWHDTHCRLDGCSAIDVLRNYVQRWNHGVKTAKRSLPLLCPDPDTARGEGTCEVQVLRSATRWSVGAAHVEDSVHYIFIENQYFISSTLADELLPRNKIALALLDRLRKAMRGQGRFHVFIILPLFPAGSLKDIATRFVLRWVYKTINLFETSILQALRKEFPHMRTEDYVTFYNLRNFGFLNDRWCTQQIYVHSKLMIVDDKHVIIGSANINDRSLVGERDSEIAALISDTAEVRSTMDGRNFTAAKFAITMRRELWTLLLAAHAPEDPVSRQSLDMWRHTANVNSRIYRQVFPRIEDNLHRLDEWEPISWSERDKVEEDRAKLRGVQGFVVEFTSILRDAPMAPKFYQKEWFVDIDTFL